MQWVLCYLTDDDLVEFLIKCRQNLSSNGLIVAKENVSEGVSYLDKSDNSVARTRAEFEDIFKRAGLSIEKNGVQQGLPEGLMEVRMWVLKPIVL